LLQFKDDVVKGIEFAFAHIVVVPSGGTTTLEDTLLQST
jgi:hypothetical protein